MSRAPAFAPGDPVVLTTDDYLWIRRGATGRVRRSSEGMALVDFDRGPVGWVSRRNLAVGVELEEEQ